jgi:magnesium-transporting ATPase (P-type)
LSVNSLGFIVFIFCFFFAIYFAGLSFYTVDASLKVQLLALSTSFFVAGIVVLISWIILLALKRLFKEYSIHPTHSIPPICGKIELGNRKSPRSLRIGKFTRSWNLFA